MGKGNIHVAQIEANEPTAEPMKPPHTKAFLSLFYPSFMILLSLFCIVKTRYRSPSFKRFRM